MIDAMPNAGHGLLHTLLRELELECFTGILEPPVTGEQLYRFLLCLKKYIDIDEIGGVVLFIYSLRLRINMKP